MSSRSGLMSRVSTSTLGSGALAGLVLRLITAAATPLSIFLAARSLGSSDFALYAAAIAGASTVGLLCSLQARELIARASEEERHNVWGVAKAAIVGTGAVGLIATLVATALGFASITIALSIWLIVLAQPLESAGAGQLISDARPIRTTAVQSAIPILRLSGFAVLWLSGSDSLAAFLATVAFSQILPSLNAIGHFGRTQLTPLWAKTNLDGATVRAGLGLTLALSSAIVIQRSDVALLRILDEDGPSGEYLTTLQVLDVPWLLFGALLTFIIPALRERQPAERAKLVKQLLLGMSSCLAAAATVSGVLTPVASGFLLGAPLSQISDWTIAFAAGATVVSMAVALMTQYLVVQRNDGRLGLLSIGAAIGNLIANLILIPSFGAAGAAAATFVAYALLLTGLSFVANEQRLLLTTTTVLLLAGTTTFVARILLSLELI